MRDMTGEVLQGRFSLDAFLAAGGMGEVYRGTQLSVGRPVAIKLLRGAGGEQATSRFLREAKSISALAHPNIVSLVDYGQDGELTYLVMEFVQGTSLGELGAGRVASPALVFELLYQVASGLAEAHERGLVHRDLKPDNLLVVRQASGALLFKVVDFGIAHVTNATDELTASGSILGTPCYMSPEQAQDHPIDGRADLFSLGIIAYELACGDLPFYAGETLQVMLKICHTPHVPLTERVTGWPPQLIALIESLLHKSPDARPASASELLRRLDALRPKLGLEAVRAADDEALRALFIEPGQAPQAAHVHRSDASDSPRPAAEAARMPLAALLAGLIALIVVSGGVAAALLMRPGAGRAEVAAPTPAAPAAPAAPVIERAATPDPAPDPAPLRLASASAREALAAALQRSADSATRAVSAPTAEVRPNKAGPRGPKASAAKATPTATPAQVEPTEPKPKATEPEDPLKKHTEWLNRPAE